MQLTRDQQITLERLFRDDLVLAPEQKRIFGTDASRRFEEPLCAVRIRSEEQAAELLRWAQREAVPIYPRGSGTNVVGGCVPGLPGVAVSMSAMNRIKDIDAGDFVAVVEPGAITGEIQKQAEAKGLFYPPDPASVNASTIGGNVATGAGGMRAVKYGVTGDYVLGLRAVLPGGEIVRAGARTHKNVVGLDLRRLFVGSEGTLGLITELTLKLLPLPEATATVLACFTREEDALDAGRAVFGAGLVPTALEYMPEEVLRAIEKLGASTPWPTCARAALLVKVDGSQAAVAAELGVVEKAMRAAGADLVESGRGRAAEESLWELRRLINPASFQVAPDKISDDVTVPRSQVAPAVAAFRAIGEEFGLAMLVFGHLGDGNLHVNIMHDAAVEGEADKAKAAQDAVLKKTVALGGTLSGEHGVGLTKLPYLDLQLSRLERDVMLGVKKVFDPKGIMNPQKAF
jgi:D-lactate dehydrogenase (cytochrome)/glycolate oxidase